MSSNFCIRRKKTVRRILRIQEKVTARQAIYYYDWLGDILGAKKHMKMENLLVVDLCKFF